MNLPYVIIDVEYGKFKLSVKLNTIFAILNFQLRCAT